MSSTRDKILRETSPLSIFFVKSGSGGNRLLFRYPFDANFQYDPDLALSATDLLTEKDLLQYQSVINESDEALSNMFSVNPNLCGQKLEIKISNVRHVGHPMSLLTVSAPFPVGPGPGQATCGQHTGHNHNRATSVDHHTRTPAQRINLDLASYDCLTAPSRQSHTNQGDITSFNIVCALRASASYDIVDCYHDLSKRLAVGLSFEERRDSYLSKEIRTILTTLEENDMAKLKAETESQEDSKMDHVGANTGSSAVGGGGGGGLGSGNDIQVQNLSRLAGDPQSNSIFGVILERSNLARDLKRIFVSLATTGIIDLKINNFVRVSFCLPQRVHRLKLLTHQMMPAIGNDDIKRCLLALRPYHGLLLLQEQRELLNSLPIDASPAFIQLIRVTKPDKNFMELSVDANLTLMQIFHIVSQLIYWAKATVIYPICDSNIYAIHPLASSGLSSKLVQDFKVRFPSSKQLHHYLADFSEGISLSQLNGPLLSLEEKLNLLSIVTWLLQRRILTQMHKYIFLVVDKEKYGRSATNGTGGKGRQLGGGGGGGGGAHLGKQQFASSHANNNENSSPSQGIEMGAHPGRHMNGLRLSSNLSNSFDASPRMFKSSLNDSFEGSIPRFRADSLTESQEDSNFGLNSSLSSTPNSNLDFPSPSNGGGCGGGGGDLSRLSYSGCFPLDGVLAGSHVAGQESIMAALQRAGLSQAGARHVMSIPSSRNVDDLKLLLRLVPYFNGKHHLEDIMFLENLERSQVLILCDKFRDILFTCHYEDVAVSQLCPFTSAK